MDKKKYRLLLLDERWKEKAKYIRKRDNHTCQNCGKTDCVLDVHHKNYIIGKNPWEIPSRYLITLCRSCHKKEHTKKKISEFFITPEEFREKRKEIQKPHKKRHKTKKRDKKLTSFEKRDEKIWRTEKKDIVLHSKSKRMEKNIETNRNWESLIDGMTVEQIQSPTAKERIFDNQFDSAKRFIKAMMSYNSPEENEFTSRNHHLLVSALPQSGKTGFMCAVANIINTLPGLRDYLKIKSVWFITGMNDVGLQKQTTERILDQVIGASDENVDSGIKDKVKSCGSFFKNYRNQELRSPSKLGIDKCELKNALIFIDEAHYGTSEQSILQKFFGYHNLDFKNRVELRSKDIYITSISATNTSEIFSDLADSKQHIILEPAKKYYGSEEFLNNGQVFDAVTADFKKDKKTGVEPIVDYIKTAYNDMCKFAYEEIRPRFNPETGERDYTPRGCVFIRASKKVDSTIKKNEWISEKFDVILIDTSTSKKVNYESVFTNFQVMLNAPNQKPVIFLVKGGYRAGITKHPQIKDYTFMVYDRSVSVLSTIQGLMGRMCGVREDWSIAKWTKFYVNKEHVVQYVRWDQAHFDRENVPGKPTWVSSTQMTQKQILDRITSPDFDKDSHTQFGSETIEDGIILRDLTDEQILTIYDIWKNTRSKSTNELDKNVETRLTLEEKILKPLGLDKEYDFIAEVYIAPGGFNEGIGIDGTTSGKPGGYSPHLRNVWWNSQGVGGVKSHGNGHFEYVFGRDMDPNIDEGKIAVHVVMNDSTKQLRLIKRRLVVKYVVYNQEKWYNQSKDTNLVEDVLK
jgi:hypothetical protein